MTTNVPPRPYLKPWYRIARHEGALLFQAGDHVVTLEGRAATTLLPVLLPLLDGTRTLGDIHTCIGENIRPATEQALHALAKHGLLIEGPPFDPGHDLARDSVRFHAAYGRGPSEAQIGERLSAATVGVFGSGPFAEACARELSLSGVGTVAPIARPWPERRGSPFQLVVVAPAREELAAVRDWNAHALRERLAWMLASPYDGSFPFVGPLFLPGDTACYECYLLRRASNAGDAATWSALCEAPGANPVPHALSSFTAALLAMLSTRWLALDDHFVPGRFYSIVPGQTVTMTSHTVYRVPRCPVCSAAARSGAPSPWFEPLRPEVD